MELLEINYPNKDDFNDKFWNHNYKIMVTTQGIMFHVNADCEQDALDFIMDFCTENKIEGLYLDNDTVDEYTKEGWIDDFITAGNESKHFSTAHICITKFA